ncbi:nuclear transport factor 2 family protein [Arthrobacter crusticola]|uniref:nuclear transport factor 2 family protein n=1 Tax=Arthrobacter crusticola TaxID=2547960 RepID=UPI001404A0A4|nr:nuclear transport factor 2 family protein [Arthrobacter crusticola]
MSPERAVQEVLARYTRATDRRDGVGQGALFTDDAVIEIFEKTFAGDYQRVGEPMIGGAAVAYAVDNFMAPHPPGGSSHHLPVDSIIEVNGDTAHFNAQFVVFKVQGSVRPDGGWPEGALGAQGTVTPIEAGYYDTDLRRIDNEWKIVHHKVLLDLPMALPGA